MASVVELLEALTGEATPTRAQPVAKDIAEGESIFTAANAVDTPRILDRYGIEHEERHARCPGCGEPGALICERGGLKCLHNRCSHVGLPNHPSDSTSIWFATVSACVAKKVEVEVRSGWREPLNTYRLVALEPAIARAPSFATRLSRCSATNEY